MNDEQAKELVEYLIQYVKDVIDKKRTSDKDIEAMPKVAELLMTTYRY